MGGVVVDDDNHTVGLGRFCYMRTRSSGLLQEFTQPRNLLHAKVMGMRLLEKGAFVADAKDKLIVSMRLPPDARPVRRPRSNLSYGAACRS
jgi:hypothetical protein